MPPARPGSAGATAATAARTARTHSRPKGQETRNQAVVRRLAELVSQKDWAMVEAGRSLHDDLGQVLTAAGIQFDLMAQEASRAYPEIADKLQSLQALLEECQVRTRVISRQMHRSPVDRLGLKSAIERVRDRWESGFAGFISIECAQDVRPPASAARAIVAMVEHGMELACNRGSCTRIEVLVVETDPGAEASGQGRFQASVHLTGVSDPFQNIEEEVRWHVVRGSCQIAGGEARIEFTASGKSGIILKAQFG